MSTLDQADIDVMTASHTCAAATKFQYDYLNDDVTSTGEIDYGLTNKLPAELVQAIADAKERKKGAKKILVLMNPPYAEAANSQGNAGKSDVASTLIGASMGLGYAGREVFVQFLVRIAKELPNATIAMFSTLKYVNAPNFEQFRGWWKARYLNGFIVHSKAFDGLKGNFPIGFLVWDAGKKEQVDLVRTRVLDRDGIDIGEKSFKAAPNHLMLSEWMVRLKKNEKDAIPLTNAVTPVSKVTGLRNTTWSDGAIAHFFCNGNDLQNAGTMTAIFSSVHSIGHAGGYFITKDNLWQAAVMFAVRMVVKHTWINHNDQFLQPTGPISNEFKNDCLIYMLFAGKNLTAGADGLVWNGKKWSLTNHFIPYSEDDVGANARFESRFMFDYLNGRKLSKQAQAVLDEGREIWRAYHARRFERNVRDEYKLNRTDVGWYQVRMALEANGEHERFDFAGFKKAYEALSAKLREQVYSLGFLPQPHTAIEAE